jgi:hypothetical protein
MKQCPVCKTTYTDESLRYCLADGATLSDLAGEQATVAQQRIDSAETVFVPTRGDKLRVDIPPDSSRSDVPPNFAPATAANRGSSGVMVKVLLAVLGVVVLGLIAIAAVTLIYLYVRGPDRAAVTNSNSNKESRTPVTSPTPMLTGDDTNELREQIANLEKKLNEQRTSNRPMDVPLSLPNQTTSTTSTARVNSPGDGFLALRTFPGSDVGSRILAIPHGATITVGGCLGASRVGSKTGRWCRASYKGYSGWVFDAFLVY